VPHVFAPAEDLADEALDCDEGCVTPPVGVFGRFDGVQRVQDAEIERHGQQRMRHRPVLTHDGVLVAAEAREAVIDEAVERTFGLVGCDGEQPRAVVADGWQLHAVEIMPDLLIDVVFARLVGLRNIKCCLIFRWWLAVVFVVVPAAVDRLVAIHQYVEPAALAAVEVLHTEAAAVARPLGEVLAGECERRGGQDVGDAAVGMQPLDEIFRRRATSARKRGSLGTSMGTPATTPQGQQLRAWPIDSVCWTEQVVAIHTTAGMRRGGSQFLGTASDLLVSWSG
jgi:hypothetical protein